MLLDTSWEAEANVRILEYEYFMVRGIPLGTLSSCL